MLFLILSGQQPFKGATNEETFTNIVDGKYSFSDSAWDTISNDAKDLIQKMLTWDENARPTAAEALKHPWIISGGTSRTIKSLQEAGAVKAQTKVEEKNDEKREEEFDPLTKLKFATCSFVATKVLPKGEAKKVEEAFCAVVKKDEKLSMDEAKAAYCKVLGVNLIQKELDQILSNVGADSSIGFRFSEFVYGVLDKKGLLTKDSLVKTFEVFGQDKSGSITKQDLKDLLKLDLALEKKAAKSIAADIEAEQVSLADFLSMAGLPPSIVKRVGKESKTDGKKVESESDSEASEKMTDSDASNSETDEDARSLGEKSAISADSHSVKFSASSFVSHRLGQLTEHYEIIDYIAKGTSKGQSCNFSGSMSKSLLSLFVRRELWCRLLCAAQGDWHSQGRERAEEVQEKQGEE